MCRPNFFLLLRYELEDRSINKVWINKRYISRQKFESLLDKQLCNDIKDFRIYDNVLYIDFLFASAGMIKCLTA